MEVYIESPIDRIVDVHFGEPEQPPEPEEPPPSGTQSFIFSGFGGGISSDGMALGTYDSPEFSARSVSISYEPFAAVIGSGNVTFSMEMTLVQASDGAIVARGGSQTIAGTAPFDSSLTLALNSSYSGGSGLKARAIVTASEVSGKTILFGIWLGGARSGWNGTVTYSD